MTTSTLTSTKTTSLTTTTWSSFPPKGRKVEVKRTEGPPARNGRLEGVLYYASVGEVQIWRQELALTSPDWIFLDRPHSFWRKDTLSHSPNWISTSHSLQCNNSLLKYPYENYRKRSNCWRGSELETGISINIVWLDRPNSAVTQRHIALSHSPNLISTSLSF